MPLSSILASDVLAGPAEGCDELAQASCIPPMYLFHSGHVSATQLTGLDEFLAHSHIFTSHGEEFAAQVFVRHEADVQRNFSVERRRGF